MEGQAPSVCCNVYVAGLPPDLSDAQLHDLFGTCGTIHSARIMRAKGTRASKGYGFVLYEDPTSASIAVITLNGLIMAGHRIQTRLAHPVASGSLRKYVKRATSTPSSTEQSPSTTPMMGSLAPPISVPLMAGFHGATVHQAAAAYLPVGQHQQQTYTPPSSFSAAPLLNPTAPHLNGTTPVNSPTSSCDTPPLHGSYGAQPTLPFGGFLPVMQGMQPIQGMQSMQGMQPFNSQPMYIIMLGQNGQHMVSPFMQ